MKLVLNLSLLMFAFLTIDVKSYSMSDFQINKICKNEKKDSNCIKNLKKKRSNLQKGNYIEIPVIPYK